MFAWLHDILRHRRPDRGWSMPLVCLTADGFRLDDDSRTIHVHWSDVDQIVTWKEDVLVYDDIWLAFHRRSANDWARVGEQHGAFLDISFEMARRFPDVPPHWYFTVMHPAFERNFTVLYKSPHATAERA